MCDDWHSVQLQNIVPKHKFNKTIKARTQQILHHLYCIISNFTVSWTHWRKQAKLFSWNLIYATIYKPRSYVVSHIYLDYCCFFLLFFLSYTRTDGRGVQNWYDNVTWQQQVIVEQLTWVWQQPSCLLHNLSSSMTLFLIVAQKVLDSYKSTSTCCFNTCRSIFSGWYSFIIGVCCTVEKISFWRDFLF